MDEIKNNGTEAPEIGKVDTTDKVDEVDEVEYQNNLRELFHNLYSQDPTGNGHQKAQNLMLSIKSMLERIPGVNGFVTERIKEPLSTYKKYRSKSKYQHGWNKIKDLLGLMIVVDTNKDVDNVIKYVKKRYEVFKNPNSSCFYRDFRETSVRTLQPYTDTDPNYDVDLSKGYQTGNGYKNVRMNLMLDGYPIEIQVKTKEQYIAHMATHDSIYKTTEGIDKKKCEEVSDALFPYFETMAHYFLHKDDMSEEELKKCDEDASMIYSRNQALYTKYPTIYNNACQMFAAYMFILKNQKEIFTQSTLGPSIINIKLLESEILRVFDYVRDLKVHDSKDKNPSDFVNETIQEIIDMDYDKLLWYNKKLYEFGDYKLDSCTISGIYEFIRGTDVDMIQSLSKTFKKIYIGVYSDELAELYLGHKPAISAEERKNSIYSIKNVTNAAVIDIDGNIEELDFISPLNLPEKKYQIGYLPGVFDLYHPGHRQYIDKALSLCDKLIVGTKSSFYVQIIKNKDTILSDAERIKIFSNRKGVENVTMTDYDITPSQNVIGPFKDPDIKSVIFIGSDWTSCPKAMAAIDEAVEKGEQLSAADISRIEKLDENSKKTTRSLLEYYSIKRQYPHIDLFMIPREENSHSSSKYRQQGIASLKDVNPNEISTKGPSK